MWQDGEVVLREWEIPIGNKQECNQDIARQLIQKLKDFSECIKEVKSQLKLIVFVTEKNVHSSAL